MHDQSVTIRKDIVSLVGNRNADIYQEVDGTRYSDGITPRLVISSIDPEFEGRVMAEMQLIDSDGFTVFYSEPRDTLPEKWVAQFDGKSYSLTIE